MRGRVATALVIAACVAGPVGCGDSDDPEAAPSATAGMCPAAETSPANPFDAQTLVGQTVDDATAAAAQHDCTVRVTERDGKPLPATMDLQNNRIDVTVVDGKITAVSLS
jgi:hypothetical protein